jgi:hypothetical protein
MTTKAVAARQSSEVSQAPRIDVRGLLSHHLAPYKIARPFDHAAKVVEQHRTLCGRNARDELMALKNHFPGQRKAAKRAAREIRPLLPAAAVIYRAESALLEAIDTPADEPTTRILIGCMLDAFRQEPGDGAAVYVEALVWSVIDGGTSDDNSGNDAGVISAAVLASAVQTAWRTQTFPPSIHEFLTLCRKRRRAIETDLVLVRSILSMREAVAELLGDEPSAAGVSEKSGDPEVLF